MRKKLQSSIDYRNSLGAKILTDIQNSYGAKILNLTKVLRVILRNLNLKIQKSPFCNNFRPRFLPSHYCYFPCCLSSLQQFSPLGHTMSTKEIAFTYKASKQWLLLQRSSTLKSFLGQNACHKGYVELLSRQ